MAKILIVNPKAGNGKGLEVANKIKDIYPNEKVVIYPTKCKGDATIYIKNNVTDKDTVYSIGGDGTLHEIVNGLVCKKAKLCVVPSGSGNDFYKSNDNTVEKIIDVGYANDEYFINSFSIGLDADVGINAEKFKKKYIPRNMIYNLSIIYTILNYKSKELEIDLASFRKTMITVMNGQYYGGGFRISPDAKIDDGYLDLTVVDELNTLKLVKLLTKVIKQTHTTDKYVNISRIKNIRISSPSILTACIDGELVRSNDFEIGIREKCLTLYNDPNIDVRQLIKK